MFLYYLTALFCRYLIISLSALPSAHRKAKAKNGSAKLQTRKPEYVKESSRSRSRSCFLCRRKGVESWAMSGGWENWQWQKMSYSPSPPASPPPPSIQSNFLQVADIKAILYLAKCHRRLKNTDKGGVGWRKLLKYRCESFCLCFGSPALH